MGLATVIAEIEDDPYRLVVVDDGGLGHSNGVEYYSRCHVVIPFRVGFSWPGTWSAAVRSSAALSMRGHRACAATGLAVARSRCALASAALASRPSVGGAG